MTLTVQERDLLMSVAAIASAESKTQSGMRTAQNAIALLMGATVTPDPDPNISPELQAHIRDWRKRHPRQHVEYVDGPTDLERIQMGGQP